MSLGTVAFIVVVLELVGGFVLGYVLLGAWRKVAPQIKPLLAMFAPPAPPASSSTGHVVHTATGPRRCVHIAPNGERCSLEQGHEPEFPHAFRA